MNQNLRLMRKKARISLKALAAQMGISRVKVEYIERYPEICPLWADKYVEALTRLTA